MHINHIIQWLVRIPGEAALSRHASEAEACKACIVANFKEGGHLVCALHQNGDVTGPYFPLQ